LDKERELEAEMIQRDHLLKDKFEVFDSSSVAVYGYHILVFCSLSGIVGSFPLYCTRSVKFEIKKLKFKN